MGKAHKTSKNGGWKRCRTSYRTKKRRGERQRLEQVRLMSACPKANIPTPNAVPHMVPIASKSSKYQLRSKDSSVITVHEDPPDPQTNNMYRDYTKMMALPISNALGCRYLPNDCHRPPYVPPIEHLNIFTFPKWRWFKDMMLRGVVVECELHKVVYIRSKNKFNKDEHTFPVRVPYAYLESILIPLGEAIPDYVPPPGPEDSPHKYAPVDQDPMLQDAHCRYEESGARVFWRNGQKMIRVGDYQKLKFTIRQLAQFGGNCNSVASICVNCIHKYDLLENAKERDDVEGKDFINHQQGKNHNKEARQESVQEITRAMGDFVLACDLVGPPVREERMRWSDLNFFNLEADKYRQPKMLEYTRASREKTLSFLYSNTQLSQLHPSDVTCLYTRLMRVHYAIIMQLSTQLKDELLFDLYIKLTHGRLSPEEMLAPLHRVSYFKLFEHLSEVCCRKSYSGLHHIRAKGLLDFLLVLQGTYAGQLPHNVKKMKAMRYIGPKISAVTLNQCGNYLKGGRPGMGSDSHCRNFMKPIILKTFRKWNGKYSDPGSEVDRLSSLVPPYPGRMGK